MTRDDRSPARAALERRSAPLLLFLHRLPRWTLVVAVAALLFGGLLLQNAVGGVLLLLVAALLGWLLALAWPALPTGGRLMRLGVVGVVLACGVWMGVR